VTFDLMDRPVTVTEANGTKTNFLYAPDGSRYRERVYPSADPKFGPRTVYSIDKDYEVVIWDQGQLIQERSYIGDSVVVTNANGARVVHFVHKDRLGSIDVETDSTPNATEQVGYGREIGRRAAIVSTLTIGWRIRTADSQAMRTSTRITSFT
jgi:hypothetical protein